MSELEQGAGWTSGMTTLAYQTPDTPEQAAPPVVKTLDGAEFNYRAALQYARSALRSRGTNMRKAARLTERPTLNSPRTALKGKRTRKETPTFRPDATAPDNALDPDTLDGGPEHDVVQTAYLAWHKSKAKGKSITPRTALKYVVRQYGEDNAGALDWYFVIHDDETRERHGPYRYGFLAHRAARKQGLDKDDYGLVSEENTGRGRSMRLERDSIERIVFEALPDDADAEKHLLCCLLSGDTCVDVSKQLGLSPRVTQYLLKRTIAKLDPSLFTSHDPSPRLTRTYGDAIQSGTPRRDADDAPSPSPTTVQARNRWGLLLTAYRVARGMNRELPAIPPAATVLRMEMNEVCWCGSHI